MQTKSATWTSACAKAAAAFSFLLAAGCATGPTRVPAPRAIVENNAVRSVFFLAPAADCKAGPRSCAGPVPSEYAAYLRSALEAEGFEILESQAQAAPVIRVIAEHTATSAASCTMEGELIVADNVVEVKRTYSWPPGTYAALQDAAGRTMFAEPVQRQVLRWCLASFAKTLRSSL